MDIKNLTGLEKPLTKLIEATISGIGVLGNHFFEFDAKKIERTGNAETNVSGLKIIELAKSENEANLIRYEGMSEIEKLIKQKHINKETKRLKNIGDTLVGTQKILESGEDTPISDTPVDEDWSTRFFDNVQDISDMEMKNVWSKILAGEIQQPGSYSLRTLETLKNISKQEAETFNKMAGLVSDGGSILKLGKDGKDIFKTFDIKYKDILTLQEAGLFLATNTLSLSYETKDVTTFIVQINFKNKFIYCRPNKNNINFPIIGLTQVGCDLFNLISPKVNEIYFNQLVEYLKTLGCSIEVKDLEKLGFYK